MNINNIKVGNIFRNYKQLCKVLEEEVKTSNSKNAQLKDWQRYFSYVKKGHKYINESRQGSYHTICVVELMNFKAIN